MAGSCTEALELVEADIPEAALDEPLEANNVPAMASMPWKYSSLT